MRCQLMLGKYNASKSTLSQLSACPVEFAHVLVAAGVVVCGVIRVATAAEAKAVSHHQRHILVRSRTFFQ